MRNQVGMAGPAPAGTASDLPKAKLLSSARQGSRTHQQTGLLAALHQPRNPRHKPSHPALICALRTTTSWVCTGAHEEGVDIIWPLSRETYGTSYCVAARAIPPEHRNAAPKECILGGSSHEDSQLICLSLCRGAAACGARGARSRRPRSPPRSRHLRVPIRHFIEVWPVAPTRSTQPCWQRCSASTHRAKPFSLTHHAQTPASFPAPPLEAHRWLRIFALVPHVHCLVPRTARHLPLVKHCKHGHAHIRVSRARLRHFKQGRKGHRDGRVSHC